MRIEIELSPKQTMFDRAVEEFDNTLYGGAKGGGKSGGLRRILLKRRIQYAGTVGVIFRKTYPELYENHISKIFTEFPQLERYYLDKHKQILLPNKSILKFRYCERIGDLEKQRGQEYDDLGVEEAGQWQESWLLTLKQANRPTRPGNPVKFICTGNPGGIGHKGLKRLFISKQHTPEEAEESWGFVKALVDDNPWLMNDGGKYKRTLKMEKNPALRSAYLEGNWDIFAGQFFDEIDRDTHLIKPFDIPPHWSRFCSYDYGFNHPNALGWFAVDEDGNVYLYREHNKSRELVEQTAKHFNSFEDAEKVRSLVYAGHDCWAKKGVGPTIAEEFAKHKIYLRQANIDRIQGAAQVRNFIAWRQKENKKPKFFIFETCPIAFECLTRMQHDPDRIEDVLKVDADQGDPYTGDDSYDMIRMGLMSRPIKSQPEKKGWRDRYDMDEPTGGEAGSWKVV